MKFMISILTVIFALVFSESALADPCASVKREMIYGRVALQDAKDKQDYLESAKQFEAAVDKAPNCATAHFNLGLVYEKAEEYQKALKAMQQYLSLSPNASDAESVREKIFELEYRAQKMLKATQQVEKKKTNRWAHLSGKWCFINYNSTSCLEGPIRDYQVDVRRGKITIFQETVSVFYPCLNLRNLVNGTIDDAGRIHGIITQHEFAKTPNCGSGDHPWGQWAKVMEYSINGHINTANNLITLEYYEVFRSGDRHRAVMKIRKR